jgi:hypothetical protein
VLQASVSRTRAGRPSDDDGARADRAQVSSLLRESYRALNAGVQ